MHVDVKKLRAHPGRAHGRAAPRTDPGRAVKVSVDSVHSLIEDHSRLTCSETLGDEKGTICAGFLTLVRPTSPPTALRASSGS